MSKTRKKGKKGQQTQVDSYKKFLADILATLKKFDLAGSFPQLSTHYKRKMWDHKIVIRHPVAGNDNICVKELKHIAAETKKYFHTPTLEVDDKKISSYELLLLNCYCDIRVTELENMKGVDAEDPEIAYIKTIKDKTLETFHWKYFMDYFRIITGLNNPDKKYYGVHTRYAYVCKDSPSVELVTSILGYDAITRTMTVNGQKRPAFRLARTDFDVPLIWISINSNLIGDFYKGHKKELEVYIQSHALSRMRERLDLLSPAATNYVLWENTYNITGFTTYKGYLYLPVKLHDIKVGYLLANIIDDNLLFRTFLFITHNSTPEGDKLKQISGLGKHDITYWHIDRLSTFVKFNEEKYPGLGTLFNEAGLGDLNHLKNKEFDIDSLQEANLDGLAEYIRQGQVELED